MANASIHGDDEPLRRFAEATSNAVAASDALGARADVGGVVLEPASADLARDVANG